MIYIGGIAAQCPHCDSNDLTDHTATAPAHFTCNGCGTAIAYTEVLQRATRQAQRKVATVLALDSSRKHLLHAVELITKGDGSLVDRLWKAHETALRHVLPDSGLPERLRPAFHDLMIRLDELFKSENADPAKSRRLAKEVVRLQDELYKEPS